MQLDVVKVPCVVGPKIVKVRYPFPIGHWVLFVDPPTWPDANSTEFHITAADDLAATYHQVALQRYMIRKGGSILSDGEWRLAVEKRWPTARIAGALVFVSRNTDELTSRISAQMAAIAIRLEDQTLEENNGTINPAGHHGEPAAGSPA